MAHPPLKPTKRCYLVAIELELTQILLVRLPKRYHQSSVTLAAKLTRFLLSPSILPSSLQDISRTLKDVNWIWDKHHVTSQEKS